MCNHFTSNYVFHTHPDACLQQCTQTCIELKMVNSHANTVVLRSMVRIPNTQVSPSKGRRITVALKVALLTEMYKLFDL